MAKNQKQKIEYSLEFKEDQQNRCVICWLKLNYWNLFTYMCNKGIWTCPEEDIVIKTTAMAHEDDPWDPEGLKRLAPHKSRGTILRPMKQIQLHREANKEELAVYRHAPRFAPAGQSTQMIVGASGESDFQIISAAESLYRNFSLKRVFYSAFVSVNEDKALPVLPQGPPLLREHRLYQADWLLRFYGFKAEELLSERRPNFNLFLDPKCDWAVGHLEFFPVEINRADYRTLLRVPGIGEKSARRIVGARRYHSLDFHDLKNMGVVLKRAVYFITCSGRQMYPLKIEEDYIVRNILGRDRKLSGFTEEMTYRQMSLFDDCNFLSENMGGGKNGL